MSIEAQATPPATPDPSVTFPALRELAMEQLRRFAGDTWTDHNPHDPGITSLEQWCYALTDLAYRVDFDLLDLLARPEGDDPYRSLFTPAEILGSNPVSIVDLRKVAMDVPGVRNAWIEPVEALEPAVFHDPADDTLYFEDASHRRRLRLRGVYNVLIASDGVVPEPDVAREVASRLQACRSLGEDFEWPMVLPRQGVVVAAEIDVGEADDPDELVAGIYHAIASHISPSIRFYTLAEMLERGWRIDEIINGPILSRGFIDTEELQALERKSALRASDLIQIIMNLPGVRGIRDLRLGLAASSEAPREPWILNLDLLKTPVLDLEACLKQKAISLRFGRVPWVPDGQQVERAFKRLQAAQEAAPLDLAERDLPLRRGRSRQVEHYHSFQNHMPRAYGVGPYGLEPSASPERQARARQLKAYLLLFDQILASVFSQTAHAGRLLSLEPAPSGAGVLPTYFPRLPANVVRLEEVLTDLDEDGLHSLTEDATKAGRRRERFLNHLLARFAEEFGDFAVIRDLGERIEAKRAMMADYPEMSCNRGRAFNYTRSSWDTGNISGLEWRIARKLGLSAATRRSLADLGPKDQGGFHMVEHILLRPRKWDADQWKAGGEREWRTRAFLGGLASTDPYSAQISFVFPGWVERFDSPDFRSHLMRMLRDETPAELGVRLHWLDSDAMAEFEDAFRTWLESLVLVNPS